MRRPLPVMLALVALVAAGCGSDSEPIADETGTTAQTTAQPATTEATDIADEPVAKDGTTLKIADSQFGKILFDADGQAIYLFDKEKSDKSECYGDCATEWPPVFTDGSPQAGSGVDAKLLGTTERDDGRLQVTYNGHPLYFYAHEEPEEVRCHNVPGFGGVWLVLDRSGDAVA